MQIEDEKHSLLSYVSAFFKSEKCVWVRDMLIPKVGRLAGARSYFILLAKPVQCQCSASLTYRMCQLGPGRWMVIHKVIGLYLVS